MEKNLRAMVLAAGVGSRLQPLCDVVPKPLIKVAGRTVMDYILLLLKTHGITNVISNTHHLAEQIHDHFKDIDKREGINLEFVHEAKLTGVAGGIRACKDFLSQSTSCIVMGDALADANLTELYKKHKEAVEKHDCLATVAQMQVADTSQFGVIVTESLLPNAITNSSTGARIVKFQEKPKKEEALSNWANTGIYFFEPRIFDFIPSEAEAPVYDVAKDLFPLLLEQGEYIQAVAVEKDFYWADLGTPKQYLKSIQDLSEGKVKLDLLPTVSKEAKISPEARLEGFNEIGANAVIEKGAKIKNCVIWDKVSIGENSELENCIIGPNSVIKPNSKLKDKVVVGAANSSELIMK